MYAMAFKSAWKQNSLALATDLQTTIWNWTLADFKQHQLAKPLQGFKILYLNPIAMCFELIF